MDAKPFQLSKLGSNPNDWIEATVDIAVNILKHRLKTLNLYNDEGKKVNDLITRELLGRSIWKYSEAFGKFKGCPFWSVKAYNLFFKQKSSSVGVLGKYLRHEHTFPQRLLIEKMWSLKDPTNKNIRELYDKFAVATVITKEENDKLNSREIGLRIATIDENNIWLRYNNPKIKIYMVKNPLDNMFFNYHYNLMQKAKVFK
mgnify:FL=1|tara:strand:- start:880 stop:1482 length:603 start_codon:yes stop_codon:yes gene_type:complete